MISLWKGREHLKEAARHEYAAALDRGVAAAHDTRTTQGEFTRLREQANAAEDAHHAACLQLMLTPVTSRTAPEWKRKHQSGHERDREAWLPVLMADCQRLGIDPDSIVTQPSEASLRANQMRETIDCFTEGLRLLVASDADPALVARAKELLEQPRT